MAIDLSRELAFNLSGTLLPNTGEVPNFLRPSRAYIPYIEGSSWYLREANIHEPRFLNDGSLLLEPATVNLLENSNRFHESPWVKGSLVNIVPDATLGLTKNYDADIISSGGTASSALSGTLYQEINLKPGVYTLSVYISLISGVYSNADRIAVLDGGITKPNATVNKTELSGVALTDYWGPNKLFKDEKKKWKRVILQFSVGETQASTIDSNHGSKKPNLGYNDAGEDPGEGDDNSNKVTIAFFFNGGTSTSALAGVQLEKLAFPTSYTPRTSGVTSRAADYLRYPNSPFTAKVRNGSADATAYDWTCKFTLKSFEGDGNIFYCGNVRADIVRNTLVVQCGTYQLTSPHDLARDSQIIIRHKANHSIRIYIDFLLRAQYKLQTTFIASEGPLIFNSSAPRLIKDFYVFSTALEDEIPIDPIVRADEDNKPYLGERIPGMLNCLFLLDYELPVSESKGRLLFNPVSIGPDKSAFIRFPQTRSYSEPIRSSTPCTGTQVQVTRLELLPEKAFPTDTVFRYSLTIDGVDFSARQTTATTTTLNTAVNTLRDAINAAFVNITASNTSGILTLTSLRPGVPFIVSYGPNIGKELGVSIDQDEGQIIVNSSLEFKVGAAQLLRFDREICEIRITKVEQFTDVDNVVRGRLTYTAIPPEATSTFRPGDMLFQGSYQTIIAPANYYCDTLEDLNDVKVILKSINGFMLKNFSKSSLIVTPYIKMFF